MIDEAEVQERLRRAVNAVADQANPKESSAWAPSVVPSRSSNARNRRRSVGPGVVPGVRFEQPSKTPIKARGVLVGVLVAASIVGFATLRHEVAHRVSKIDVSSTATVSSTTPVTSRLPVAIGGMEQSLREVPIPKVIAQVLGTGRDQMRTVAGTTPRAFTVNGGSVIAILEIADFGQPPKPIAVPASCAFDLFSGIGLACFPLHAVETGAKQAVGVVDPYPYPRDTTTWWHLPAATAYVTFTAPGITELWERPLHGVASFTVDAPQTSTLRAYNTQGHLLAHAPVSRIGGG